MIKPGLKIIFFLAARGINKHKFSSFVAIFTISMAAGLFLSTWQINLETRKAFSNSANGFDAVLGARGSKLQIILNSLFHLEESPGNLAWEQYELIKSAPGVRRAYPIAVGDNYHGYRLVGTEPEMFQEHEWKPGQKFDVKPGGRIFSPVAKEALVGSFVAQKLGLGVGDKFHPYHGLDFKEENKHEDIYLVVGVLEYTGTPADRVIWVPIKGIQLMEGHDKSMAQTISAVLLKLNGAAGISLHTKYNRQGNVATLAWPVASTLSSFFDKFSWFQTVLEIIATMVAIVGCMIILLSLRSSMNERKREFAILRFLGAPRKAVTAVIIWQSVILAVSGGVVGIGIHLLINLAVFQVIREKTGVVLEVFSLDSSAIFVLVAILIVGLISGILPAIQAYKNELSENLKLNN
jgi:putative ABC transport system permease protein